MIKHGHRHYELVNINGNRHGKQCNFDAGVPPRFYWEGLFDSKNSSRANKDTILHSD